MILAIDFEKKKTDVYKVREHYYKYIINFIIIDCKFNQGWVPLQQCIKADHSNLHIQNHFEQEWKRHNIVCLFIENDWNWHCSPEKFKIWFFFRLLFYSYFYKCDVVETCFVGLTVIKSIIVNNLFNHYKHNWWSQNHEFWTWCVHVLSHLLSRKIYCSRCKSCTKRSYLLTIQNYNKH